MLIVAVIDVPQQSQPARAVWIEIERTRYT